MAYMAKINFLDVTSFNDETEDWSGNVYSVDINDTIFSDTLEQLYIEVARYFGTSSEDLQQDFDNETSTYMTVEENKLCDYNITFYEINEIKETFQ